MVEKPDSQIEQYKEVNQLEIPTVVVQGLLAYGNYWNRDRRTAKDSVIGIMHAGIERLPQHVEEGLRFAENMKRADMAVNEFYHQVTHDPNSSIGQQLKKDMEDAEKGDHGYPHIRRNEEWIEAALLNTPNIRHGEWINRFWLPSLYLANRFHDSIQLISGKKDSHSELAELWLLSQTDKLAKAFNIPKEEAELYLRGAAIIVHHHSNPEQLEGLGMGVTTVSPAELYASAIADAQFLPEHMRDEYLLTVDDFRENSRPLTQGFTSESLMALKRYSVLFGFADKAESIFPGDLATVRTFLAGPAKDRPIYEHQAGERTPLAEVLRILSIDDPKYEFSSDVERKIYELGRQLPSAGSEWMNKRFSKNGIVAARQAAAIFNGLMEGNLDGVEQIFQKRNEDILFKAMRRAKVRKGDVKKVINAGSYLDKERIAKDALQARSFPVYEQLYPPFQKIAQEYEQLRQALRGKLRGYSKEDREYVGEMFRALHEILCNAAFLTVEKGDQIKQFLPYKCYDSISSPEEARRAPYR